MSTQDRTDIDRAAALAIGECLKHGGSDTDAEMLRRWFQTLADAEDAKLDIAIIPG